MKKIFLGTLFLLLTMVVPMPTMAGVDVHFSIGLPPPVVFAAPPELIVLPDTYVYVAPETDVDLFFIVFDDQDSHAEILHPEV